MTGGEDLVSPERAHRILDAAGRLVLRFGYDKTTIGEVARGAGVAKGTIYLHWKTREALFATLLRRERVQVLTEIQSHLEASRGTFPDLVEAIALGLLRRPIMKAALLGDSEVLGRLLRQKRHSEATLAGLEGVERLFEKLAAGGGTRSDIAPEEQILVMFSAMYGFLLTPPLLPGGHRPSDERLAELVAHTVDRALRDDRADARQGDPAARDVIREFTEFGLEIARQRLRESLKGPR